VNRPIPLLVLNAGPNRSNSGTPKARRPPILRPLLGADEDWADERLYEMGLRSRKKPPRRKRKPKSR
jgi:hypothetical protein